MYIYIYIYIYFYIHIIIKGSAVSTEDFGPLWKGPWVLAAQGVAGMDVSNSFKFWHSFIWSHPQKLVNKNTWRSLMNLKADLFPFRDGFPVYKVFNELVGLLPLELKDCPDLPPVSLAFDSCHVHLSAVMRWSPTAASISCILQSTLW